MRVADDLNIPLARAEEIVRRGPNPDGGPVPCEDEDSPTCFTFQELNRERFTHTECGCMLDEGKRVLHCEEHGGTAPTLEQVEEYMTSGMPFQLNETTVVGASDDSAVVEDKD